MSNLRAAIYGIPQTRDHKAVAAMAAAVEVPVFLPRAGVRIDVTESEVQSRNNGSYGWLSASDEPVFSLKIPVVDIIGIRIFMVCQVQKRQHFQLVQYASVSVPYILRQPIVATYSCVPLSPSSIIWYRPRGDSLAGKVTAGLVESNGSLPPGL